ncbi:N-acyl homoserine lactonase family protein [Lutimaribacter marinistellae]|uniref:N-acyl homoserine lactonase family protein n=1 Tax=Lutimaribacter marinistellae TaxID=1820329 RepID=A0ABV7TKU0_9RHOB
MRDMRLLKGRPARLSVLDFGLFKVHANGRVIGICGYLVETDANERVLIDSGFPAKYAENAERATQEDRLFEFGEVIECRPDQLPRPQIAKAGIDADQIDLFILTHTHIDHVGAIGDFVQAPMVISAAERALPKPLYWGQRRPLDWPEREYVVLEGDVRIGPGFEIVMAPGHAPGQIAMLVDLPETGAVLLTSDAISRPAEIDERFDTAPDPQAAIASAARLMELAAERDAFVIYGHCPEQWATLRKVPDHYG